MNIKSLVEYFFPSIYVNLVKWKNIVVYSSKKAIELPHSVSSIKLDSYRNTFWGYYDKSPFNPHDSNLVLLHANNYSALKKPSPKVSTDLILLNKALNEFTVIDSTFAWNWQQGARLHWLDKEKIIFNKFCNESKNYHAVVYDVKHEQKTEYDEPVQDSYENKFYISISYENLYRTRPDYGYRNIKPKNVKEFLKIKKIDLLTKDSEVILDKADIFDIIEKEFDIKRDNARVNHVMISPNGENFIFLFRINNFAGKKHWLLHYSFRNHKLKVLLADQMVSHYSWVNDEEIILWGNINKTMGYYLINVESLKMEEVLLNVGDGHPSNYNKDFYISDSYPDKNRLRSLFFIDKKLHTKKHIGSFFESPLFIGETRCDLHPTLSAEKKYLSFDTLQNKRRVLSYINLGEL